MQSLGLHSVYVVADQDPFDAPLAQIVASDAQKAGIAVKGEDTIAILPGSNFSGEVAKIAESGAQAVFISATATSEAAYLARLLHSTAPHLCCSHRAQCSTPCSPRISGPPKPPPTSVRRCSPTHLYPASARRVLAEYTRRFASAGEPYALYGYEAMSVVLASIRAAGTHGDERQAVIGRFFATHDRHSVLGAYSMQPNGETTLSTLRDRPARRRLARVLACFRHLGLISAQRGSQRLVELGVAELVAQDQGLGRQDARALGDDLGHIAVHQSQGRAGHWQQRRTVQGTSKCF